MKALRYLAALGLALGAIASAAPASAATDQTVTPAGPVENYTVVNTGDLTAPNDVQSAGLVKCPSGLVVIGGGVEVLSTSLDANINSSWPEVNGWAANVNNSSGASVTFVVFAFCATAPTDYTVVSSPTTDNPPQSQSGARADCPSGVKVLSGGAISSSVGTAVNLNSSFPVRAAPSAPAYWQAYMNNATTTDESLQSFAVCGNFTGYELKAGAVIHNPAGADTQAPADCRSGVVTGGGVLASSSDTDVDVNSSWQNGSGGWFADENNGSASGETITAYAVCAEPGNG
jgi:hypothetical protein